MNKVALPLSTSSKSANIELGAEPLYLNPYVNRGVTAEEAPVLLSTASAETVDADAFAAKMVKSGGQGSLAQARLAVNAGLAVVEDLVDAYGAVTIQTPMGTIETFVAGTMENAQDQPDPTRNWAFLALVVPEAYRKLFAEMKTQVLTAACPAVVKRVRDKATNARGICGAKPFYLEGRGMSFGGAGEKLELLTPLTLAKVADVAVAAAARSEVQFVCTLPDATAITAGPYVLRLTTLAGGTVPWTLDLDVKLLEAVVPPTPIAQTSDGLVKVMTFTDGGQAETFTLGHEWLATGSGFRQEASLTEWWTSSVEVKPEPAGTATCPLVPDASADGKTLRMALPEGETLPAGTYPNAKVYVHQSRGESSETLELPVKLVVE